MTPDQPQNNPGSHRAGTASVSLISEFLTCPTNELALETIRLLADGRQEGYSPLVLAGESGCGKTMLLDLLEQESRRRKPDLRVTRLTGNELKRLVSQLRRLAIDDTAVFQAGRGRTEFEDWADLRYRLRQADLLLIDSLDDLAGYPSAIQQLELAIDHSFYQNSVVVLATRSIPTTGEDWSTRIISMLGGGMLVKIGMPDENTRRRYILRWSAARGLPIDPALIEEMAREPLNFRTLKGRLESLQIKSRIDARPINRELVHSLVEERQIELSTRTKPEIGEIAKLVARTCKVKLNDLIGPARYPGLVRPRHIAIYLADQLSGLSREKISQFFGNRDPATIRHAIRQMEEIRKTDFELNDLLNNLTAELLNTISRA